MKLAKEYAAKENCDIVLYAGEEDGWHYFSYTRPNLPKYASLSRAMRINRSGKIEKLGGFEIRCKVKNRADALKNTKH